MSKETMLELRRKMKARMPNFVRQQGHYKVKLALKWRQPKGQHSKLRRKYRAKVNHPGPGYSSPRLVRGLSRTGLVPVNVSNIKDLEGLKAAEHGVIFSKTLGKKNKVELLKKVLSMNLKLLNLRNAESFLKAVENEFVKKKEESKKKLEKKSKSKEEALKKAEQKKEKKEEKKEESKEEDKKEKEEAEKREVLGQK